MYAIGLMSGTSLDGIDAALIDIEENGRVQYKLVEFITLPFGEGVADEIRDCLSLDKSDVRLLCSLNFKLGYEFANACKEVTKKAGIPFDKIGFIASHGQTVWHNPVQSGKIVKSTLQIGESSVIAYETNCTVVSDFRVMDMASGGQGAPLVSFTDYLLYREADKNVVLQNIGGIANLTYLPAGCSIDEVISFDTGPGNMMIDYLMNKYYGKPYDKDGNIARSGKVNLQLLTELMNHPYILADMPKTTGREMFGKEFVEDIIKKYQDTDNADLLTTFTMYTVKSIKYHYEKYLKELDKIIVSGGGSYNRYMMELLRQEMKCGIYTMEDMGENGKAKEAVAFALLGYMTLKGRTNNVKHSTGASEDVILGNITPKPRNKGEI